METRPKAMSASQQDGHQSHMPGYLELYTIIISIDIWSTCIYWLAKTTCGSTLSSSWNLLAMTMTFTMSHQTIGTLLISRTILRSTLTTCTVRRRNVPNDQSPSTMTWSLFEQKPTTAMYPTHFLSCETPVQNHLSRRV